MIRLRRLMYIMALAVLGCVYVLDVRAGTPDTAPYSTGHICITWTKGAPPKDADADRLNLKCGTVSGQYTLPVKTITVTSPAPNPPKYCGNAKDLLAPPATYPATYYCIAKSGQGPAESTEASPEYPFTLTAPELSAPTRIELIP